MLKNLMISLICLFSLQGAYAVPKNGNLAMTPEGQVCFEVTDHSIVTWSSPLTDSKGNVWVAGTATITVESASPYTIGGQVATSGGGEVTITYRKSGEYKVKAEVTYTCGAVSATAKDSWDISFPDIVVVFIGGTTRHTIQGCDEKAVANASCGEPNYHYKWSLNGVTDFSVPDRNSATLQNISKGSKELSVDVVDFLGNEGGAVLTIEVHEKIELELTSSETVEASPKFEFFGAKNTGYKQDLHIVIKVIKTVKIKVGVSVAGGVDIGVVTSELKATAEGETTLTIEETIDIVIPPRRWVKRFRTPTVKLEKGIAKEWGCDGLIAEGTYKWKSGKSSRIMQDGGKVLP